MSLSYKVITTSKSLAKDVDDTFGFGNDKGDKEIMNQDEAKEPNFNAGTRSPSKKAVIPKDISANALTATSEGFAVAASGGIICYFRYVEQGKRKENRSTFYNS